MNSWYTSWVNPGGRVSGSRGPRDLLEWGERFGIFLLAGKLVLALFEWVTFTPEFEVVIVMEVYWMTRGDYNGNILEYTTRFSSKFFNRQ
jgi:hypothetical protein